MKISKTRGKYIIQVKKNANIHRICAKREFGSTILDSYGLARFDNDDDDGDADDDGANENDDADDEDDNHDCPPSFGLVSEPAGSLLWWKEEGPDSRSARPTEQLCIYAPRDHLH